MGHPTSSVWSELWAKAMASEVIVATSVVSTFPESSQGLGAARHMVPHPAADPDAATWWGFPHLSDHHWHLGPMLHVGLGCSLAEWGCQPQPLLSIMSNVGVSGAMETRPGLPLNTQYR